MIHSEVEPYQLCIRPRFSGHDTPTRPTVRHRGHWQVYMYTLARVFKSRAIPGLTFNLRSGDRQIVALTP
jgi:hypothetical protein